MFELSVDNHTSWRRCVLSVNGGDKNGEGRSQEGGTRTSEDRRTATVSRPTNGWDTRVRGRRDEDPRSLTLVNVKTTKNSITLRSISSQVQHLPSFYHNEGCSREDLTGEVMF